MLRQFRNSKRIEIDFVKSQNKTFTLRKTLFTSGLALFLYAIWQGFTLNQTVILLERELHAPVQEVKPQLAVESEFEKAMHQVDTEMKVAWPDIFASLEKHYQTSMTFGSAYFDARTREVSIAGHADSLHSVIEFVEHLKKEHVFEKVDLLNHHQTRLDSRAVHSFEIHAKW